MKNFITELKQPFLDKSKELDERAERHKKGFRYNSNTDYHIPEWRWRLGVALWIFFLILVATVYCIQTFSK